MKKSDAPHSTDKLQEMLIKTYGKRADQALIRLIDRLKIDITFLATPLEDLESGRPIRPVFWPAEHTVKNLESTISGKSKKLDPEKREELLGLLSFLLIMSGNSDAANDDE